MTEKVSAPKKRRKKAAVAAPNVQIDIFDVIEEQSSTVEQSEFINYKGTSSVILAATAGSGKTRSSVERLKMLLKRGVDPKRIIFFSFTKAATEELKERINNNDIKITTIHAFCLSILMRAGRKKTITNFFDFIAWYKRSHAPSSSSPWSDRDEFRSTISEMYETAELLSSQISAFKLQKADGLKAKLPDYFFEYEKYQKDNSARDFADMLIEVAEMFKEDKWLKMWKGKYDYVFIDEYQDTSTIQLRVLLALNARYYYMIGDKFQCCPSGTMVDVVPEGSEVSGSHQKKIEDINVGDMVLSGRGGSSLGPKKVTRVYSSPYNGELVKVVMKSGKVITATPEHVHFADYLIPSEELYFTYLMYKKSMGFRIGVTRSYSNNSSSKGQRFGFKNRLNQESADRIWILKTSDSLLDSILHEKIYSSKFGIPTMTFTCHNKKDIFTQEYIDKLFQELDTYRSGHEVLRKFGYDFDCPHFFPKSSRREEKVVNVRMCSDGRGSQSSHALEIGTDNEEHVEKMKKLGFSIYPNTGDKGGWRYRTQSPDLGEIIQKSKVIAPILGGLINNVIWLKHGRSLRLFKASHLLKGMTMYGINDNGHIDYDIIEEVSRVSYNGTVHDIDVDNTHNFIANGIFTHNSIFGYSGANCDKLANMLRERRKIQEMTLSVNFRSDLSIVENSNQYSDLKAVANSSEAGDVEYSVMTHLGQLKSVLDKNEEVAILVRTNKIIKQMEKEFLEMKYPLRYFNYLTKSDIQQIKDGKAHPILKGKLNVLASIYGSTEAALNFIEENQTSKKFITSIHKSKGKEFDTCVVVNSIAPEVLNDNGFDLPAKQLKKVSFTYDEKGLDERNVHYVAVSRSKHKLYFMLYGNP